jgi:hypothetical protein
LKSTSLSETCQLQSSVLSDIKSKELRPQGRALKFKTYFHVVIPAEAGIQSLQAYLDSRFRGSDSDLGFLSNSLNHFAFGGHIFHPRPCLKADRHRTGFSGALLIKKSPHLENLKILYDILLTGGERFYEDGRVYEKECFGDGV